MILSKKHEFLFLKGKKVAGTSVEMALSTICGRHDIITPITPIDEIERLKMGGRGAQNYAESRRSERRYLKLLLSATPDEMGKMRAPPSWFGSHISLKKLMKRIGNVPKGRIFAVERNPYAKIISSANMQGGNFESYKASGKPMVSDIEVLKNVISDRVTPWVWRDCRNIQRYCDSNGQLLARILRYEHLEEDFSALMAEFGISPVPNLPHAKPGINANSIDPRAVFTRQQLDEINRLFTDEFERFGYERV